MKMSFTQEKETNLHTGADGKICNGCEKRCEFGIHRFDAWSSSKGKILTYCCPTIDGQPIKQYKGPNGQIIDATREAPYEDGVKKSAKQRAIELAHKIVKYCDHYKTR